MQEPVDGERVEIVRIDFFLIAEVTGGKTNGGEREGLEVSGGTAKLFGKRGTRGCGGPDEAEISTQLNERANGRCQFSLTNFSI